MQGWDYPVYVFIQDPEIEDLRVLNKFGDLVTSVVYLSSEEKDVEYLINRNRITAWETTLNLLDHDYVLCLEDDVEISKDIFLFTKHVLNQNGTDYNFRGINYGSFEILEELSTYSCLRFGLHGPASLITKKTAKKFQLGLLKLTKGRIPWDSWVEPISKKGFMVTSNVARYRDNGLTGTHTPNLSYFQKLSRSFELNQQTNVSYFYKKDIEHSWRHDSVIYKPNENLKYLYKSWLLRVNQFVGLLRKSQKIES